MTRSAADGVPGATDDHRASDALALVTAETPAHFDAGAALFREYAEAIAVDLCFQGFDAELERIDEIYGANARGLLLLAAPSAAAASDSGAVGAVGALRAFDETRCEMKRLYVRPAARGTGVGRRIAERLVAAARGFGYEQMLLDTLEPMRAARTLYRSLGFVETESYYHNPLEGVIYMRLTL